MNFADSIFIFGLALILFGPKKLPEIGRQIGKLMLEFRRASNEFKMQIEEELRNAEQADRQKQLAAETAIAKNLSTTSEIPAASSESLTVRPPSTGSIESTESPYKPVAAESASGYAETEPYSAGLDTTSPYDLVSVPGNTTGTAIDTMDSGNSRDSGDPGHLEVQKTERTASTTHEQAGEDPVLQEQTTNRHG